MTLFDGKVNPHNMFTFGDLSKMLDLARNTLKGYQEEGFFVPPSITYKNRDYFTYLQTLYMQATLSKNLRRQMLTGIKGCKVIAIHNTKGGVSKTSTAVNLAYSLAKKGHKVCLADVDPQSSASLILGSRHLSEGDKPDTASLTIHHLLFEDSKFQDVTTRKGWEHNGETVFFDLIPSGHSMRDVDLNLTPLHRRYEHLLHKVITPLKPHYDFIILDTPQLFTQIGINCLYAADYVVIPTTATALAFDVFISIFGSFIPIIDDRPMFLNHPLLVAGVLITNYSGRTTSEKYFHDLIRHHFGGRTFRTLIPARTVEREASTVGMPVGAFDPDSDLAMAYDSFTDEVINRLVGNLT